MPRFPKVTIRRVSMDSTAYQIESINGTAVISPNFMGILRVGDQITEETARRLHKQFSIKTLMPKGG